jgi:signal transduction histidine kinase
LSEVEWTASGQRPASRFTAVVAGGLAGLTLIDLLLGVQVFHVIWPALLADAAVIGAVAFAAIAPPRTIPPATIVASAASVAISVIVAFEDFTKWTPLMGYGAWPGFAELAGLGLLTIWSVRSTPRVAALTSILSLGLALYAIVEWRNQGWHSDKLFLLSAGAWVAVVGVGWYLRVLDARQLEQQQQVRHQERLAIARELHDVVAHHVTGIVVQAQAAQLVARDHPEAAQRALDRIANAGAGALAAMRSMVGALREESADGQLGPTTSIDDLRAMATSAAQERGQLPVRIAIDEAAAALPDPILASVHRIAREAVTNARRHAVGATSIDIDVRCADSCVQLLVTNDGSPASRSPGGFGLLGMAERAAALGGDFDAGPLPNGGWRVEAELPVVVGATTRDL